MILVNIYTNVYKAFGFNTVEKAIAANENPDFWAVVQGIIHEIVDSNPWDQGIKNPNKILTPKPYADERTEIRKPKRKSSIKRKVHTDAEHSKKLYRYYGRDFEVDERLIQAGHEVLKQGSCCLYKNTRDGVTTTLTISAMEEEKQFLIVSPTNNIFNTVNRASAGQNVRIAANSFCSKLSEEVKKDKFLAKLPLPLPEKCNECNQYGKCEVTKIITSDMPVIEITYMKLEKIMLSESIVAMEIRNILAKSKVILLDEAHTIALPQAATIPIGFTLNIPSEYIALKDIMAIYSKLCTTYGEEILHLMQQGEQGHVGKHLSKRVLIPDHIDFTKYSIASNELIMLAKARGELSIREAEIEVLRDIISLVANYVASISYTKKDDIGTVSFKSNTDTNLLCLTSFLHDEGKDADHIYSSATLFYPKPNFYDDISGKPLKQITFPDIGHNNRKMIIKPDKWRLSARNFKKDFNRVINRIYELYIEFHEKGIKVFILAPNTKKAIEIRDALQEKLGDSILVVVPSVDRDRMRNTEKEVLAVDYYRDDATMGVENDARYCIAVGLAEVPVNSYDHLAQGIVDAVASTDELVVSSQALRLNGVHAASWQAWSRCKDPQGLVESIVHCIGIRADQVKDVITWGEGRRLEQMKNGWKVRALPQGGQSRTPVFKVAVDHPLELPKMYVESKSDKTPTVEPKREEDKKRRITKDYIKRLVDLDFDESITIPLSCLLKGQNAYIII